MLEHCESDIVSIVGSTKHMEEALNKKFNSIRFEDAQKELQEIEGAMEDSDCGEKVITSIGEKELIKRYGVFTWLTNMPWLIVPFYQAKETGTKYSI